MQWRLWPCFSFTPSASCLTQLLPHVSLHNIACLFLLGTASNKIILQGSFLMSVIWYLIKTKSWVHFRTKTKTSGKGRQWDEEFCAHPFPKLYLIGWYRSPFSYYERYYWWGEGSASFLEELYVVVFCILEKMVETATLDSPWLQKQQTRWWHLILWMKVSVIITIRWRKVVIRAFWPRGICGND